MKTFKADPFQAVSDVNRREILHLLSKNSYTINALAENFEMSLPAVSKHIKMLSQAGFITIEDIGRERYCILKQDGFDALQEWIDYFDKFWLSKLKKLEALLNEKAKGK
jgi:DNA-binding transcriptional ArsR family regulator